MHTCSHVSIRNKYTKHELNKKDCNKRIIEVDHFISIGYLYVLHDFSCGQGKNVLCSKIFLARKKP